MLLTNRFTIGFCAWLLCVAVLLVLSWAHWPRQVWLATDFQALLPSSSSDYRVEQANQAAASSFDRQVLWLVQGSDSGQVNEFLDGVMSSLERSGYSDPGFEDEQMRRWRQLSAALYPHRWGLLTPADHDLLESDPGAYFEQFQRMLYSPLGAQALGALESDPTGHYGRFLRGLVPSPDPSIEQPAEGSEHARLAAVSVRPEALGFDALDGLYGLYQSFREDARRQGLSLYATGVPLYSAYGVHSAKLEMSTIGLASLVVLVALLLWALKSTSAVVLTLLCVLAGVAGGLVVTVLVLRQIHVLTLVFGATLIGIAADYALHYFAHSLLPQWSVNNALSKVFKGLFFGMLSSVLAFGVLVFLPFPGIRQIGVFMASGLLCSFLTVCLVFGRVFLRRGNKQSLPAFCSAAQWVWRGSLLPVVVLCLCVVYGLAKLPGRDDVREFYSAPADLKEAEVLVQGHSQIKPDNRYFLLQAASKIELLELEQRVGRQLRMLQEQGLVGDYSGITRLIPAASLQRENVAVWRKIETQGGVSTHLQALGFRSTSIEKVRDELMAGFSPLTLGSLDQLDLPLGLGGFLGCDDEGCASWIRLAGIGSEAPLRGLAEGFANLQLIDPINDINLGISRYRVAVGGMLIVAVALAWLLLGILCGWRQAVYIVLLPVTACLLSLLITGVVQGSYSIVNLMALLLIFGVGLDYAIFRAFTDPAEQAATSLAIALSALTSILAFGMLSFSSTPIISSFGRTIALGLIIAYSLSWLRFERSAVK